ncbi:MAG: glycosyltransferase family 2 protein [Mycobacteriales bacterium]
MTTTEVDVVLPVRNGGRLLEAAVDSVLRQEGVDLRLWVVDDGSTDGAVSKLPSDPRVTVLATSGIGIPRALELGCSAGSAPYIARQDADDVSLPQRLARQVRLLATEPAVGLVATAFEVVVGRRVVATLGPGPEDLLSANPLCAGSVMVRRSVHAAAGGYRAVFACSSDYDMWLRCEEHCRLAVLPEAGYRYRLTSDMTTIRRAALQGAFAELARHSARARRAGRSDPAADADTAAAVLQAALAGRSEGPDPETDAWWAVELAALGDRREALRCLRRAAGQLPLRRSLAVLRQVLVPGSPQAVWS